jgi:hypothetical protein
MDRLSYMKSFSDKTSEREKPYVASNDSFLSQNNENYLECNLLTKENYVIKDSKKPNAFFDDKIAFQNKYYPVWRIKDAKFLGPYANTSFIGHKTEDFHLFSCNFVDVREDCERIYVFQLEENWEKCQVEEAGLNILDKILKFEKKMNLRALGCKMNLSLKLSSSADINIILRSNERMDNEEAYIISYRKEGYGEYMRLFQCIGSINDASSFIYLKKTEIPLLSLDQETQKKDELNMRIEIFDYGDSNIKLKCYIGNNFMDKPFKISYNYLLKPYFYGFSPYLIGNNGPVFIKSISIELFDRKEREMHKLTKKKNMCNQCNCQVF